MASESCCTADLESVQNRKVQSREWIAERIGFLLITGVLVSAALGFLGPGILTFRQIASSDGQLAVSHYLVERSHAPAELRIRFNSPQEDVVRLAISRSFADEITFETITPEPDYVEMQSDRLVYTFRASGLGSDGYVTFRYQNESFGWLRYEVSLENGPGVEISQFICP